MVIHVQHTHDAKYALWIITIGYNTAGSDGRGAIHTRVYNNCSVDRYHELLFFNQILIIIINRRKSKRAFHTIGRRFEYLYRIRILHSVAASHIILSLINRYFELWSITIVTMLLYGIDLVSRSSILPIYDII